MKKQIWLIALLLACTGINSRAQVSVNINIGLQPIWGPVGYDYVEYYYIPDIDVYYDVRQQQYVYFDNNVWIIRRSLPPRYSSYNLYSGYKVVINDPKPWTRHEQYRTQYVQYRGRGGQGVIRDSRDTRYYANPKHPHHKEWKGNAGNGNGGGNRGHAKGSGGLQQRQGGVRSQGNGGMRKSAGQPQPGNGGGRSQGNGGMRNNGGQPQPGHGGNRGQGNGGGGHQGHGGGGDKGHGGGDKGHGGGRGK